MFGRLNTEQAHNAWVQRSVVGVETGVGTKAVLGLILALTLFGLVLLKLDLAESCQSRMSTGIISKRIPKANGSWYCCTSWDWC